MAMTGWSTTPLAVLVTLLHGCQAAPPPSTTPPRAPEQPESPAPTVAPEQPMPAPVVEPSDSVLPLSAYRPRVERLLVGERVALLPASLDAVSRPPIGHWVVTLGPASGRPPFHTVTVGFGRRTQPHAFGTTPRYVELVAATHRDDDAVREPLSSLGQFLHAADRPISVRFQAFDTVRTEEPIFGERFFALVPSDLVPGGELAVDEELSVTLLQVIPMDEGDCIHMNMRGDGAVRAWWSAHRGSPELLHRWDGVMARQD